MGCGTSKDQPMPPESTAQTAVFKDTELQQPQADTEQAISPSKDDKEAVHPGNKIAVQSDTSSFTSADSSCARQTQSRDSQDIDQAQQSVGQGSTVPVQVAALQPAPALQPWPPSSNCEIQFACHSKAIPESTDTMGTICHSQHIGAGAARHEEEVQPFRETVAPAPAMADDMNEGSPWAYLQKAYSNVEEAAQGTSQPKGQDDGLQDSRPKPSLVHSQDGLATSMQVDSTTIHRQTSRPEADVWSRNVAEQAWGDASAAAGPAAPHQRPVKQPSGVASVSTQIVIDDLGMEDVDEFEAELAALSNAKSA